MSPLLRPETIEQINQAIVNEGHRLEPQADCDGCGTRQGAGLGPGDRRDPSHGEHNGGGGFGKGSPGAGAV